MPTELQRLIYASRWTPGLEVDVEAQVRRILDVSIPHNREADLTGLLLVHEGWFVQALEGSRARIASAMDRIFHDPRHCEVRILSSGAVNDRAFRDWSMGAAMAGPEAQPFLTELGLLAQFDAHQLDGPAAFRLMLALAEAERARERAALGLSAA
jgi:hypothetical protein